MDYIPYDQVKKSVFAQCTVPDGYFGDTRRVGVAMIGKRIVLVDAHGYYGSGLPLAADRHEALWLMHHHPTARHIADIKEA